MDCDSAITIPEHDPEREHEPDPITIPNTITAFPDRAAPAVPIAAAPSRLQSLDVFRGATIAGMLLVNNPGTWSAIYGPLRHAEWHGWTPTDLIFPFFLFIVGVAMTFSFAARMARGATRRALMLKALKRSAILFALGLALHGFPSYDFGEIRIPGVLQRIALAYLAASAVVLATWRGTTIGWRSQAAVAALLLLTYWALETLVPVPGQGPGALEPGRDLGAYIDRLVFGTEHLWIYSQTWDPEGLLSTMPAAATVLTGVLAGHWLRSDRGSESTLVGLFLAANAGLLLGVVWHQVFPINKNLWTSSYVVFTSGMALHFLAVCYWLVDVKQSRRWAMPFVVFGVNAIAAFFLSSLFARVLNLVQVGDGVALKAWLFQNLFVSWLAPINASLAFAIVYVLVWLAAMWALYRARIFVKV